MRYKGSLAWDIPHHQFYTRVLGRVLGRTPILGITRAAGAGSWPSVVAQTRNGRLGCELPPGARGANPVWGSPAVNGDGKIPQPREPDCELENRAFPEGRLEIRASSGGSNQVRTMPLEASAAQRHRSLGSDLPASCPMLGARMVVV